MLDNYPLRRFKMILLLLPLHPVSEHLCIIQSERDYIFFQPITCTRQDREGRLAHATFPAFTMQTLVRITIHTTPEEFENATITGHFEFVFDENSIREIT